MDDDTRQDPEHRFGLPWSIDDEAAAADSDEVTVVDLAEATVRPDRQAHCPACQSHRMEAVVTNDGKRYEHCLACGRLWADHEGRLNLVLGAEIVNRR